VCLLRLPARCMEDKILLQPFTCPVTTPLPAANAFFVSAGAHDLCTWQAIVLQPAFSFVRASPSHVQMQTLGQCRDFLDFIRVVISKTVL
jgi:hypothetical protein